MIERGMGLGLSFLDYSKVRFQKQSDPDWSEYDKIGKRDPDDELPMGPEKPYVPEDPPFPEGAEPSPGPTPGTTPDPSDVWDWTNH